MGDWIEIVRLVTWPLIVALVVLVFRRPLIRALDNATEVKIAGQSIRIARERLDVLDKLIGQMERAEKLPDNGPQGDLHRRLMDRAQADPFIGLSELDSAIRAEISMLALTNGWVDDLAKGPSDLWFQLLRIHQLNSSQQDSLPALFLFSELLDASLTQRAEFRPGDLLRTMRVGLRVHAYVRSIPKRTSTVLASRLPVYIDRERTQPRPDIHAVLIRTQKTPADDPEDRVWPSNRQYEPGTRVSWIFDDKHSWDESWWHNEQTDESILVWKSGRYSFVGDPLTMNPSDIAQSGS
ncbi:hypothetical protein ABZS29_21335 [Kribbella sp. NPDC005582]|uniref:hypothetical protein n=1 Tax=Kribbella sp. NPDC005582 TaxID=3156893 RepID=UPI0033B3A866